jgi:hypothetical protein
MHKVIEGIYDNGRITFREKPVIKKAIVEVKFIREIDDLKIFKDVPDIFKNPIKISQIQKISREELHAR